MKINFDNIFFKNRINLQQNSFDKNQSPKYNTKVFYIPIMDIMGDSFVQSIMSKNN